MQAASRMASVMSSRLPVHRRLIRSVRLRQPFATIEQLLPMNPPRITAIALCSFFFLTAIPAGGRDAGHDLRHMVGYTIVGAALVQEAKQGRLGETIIIWILESPSKSRI